MEGVAYMCLFIMDLKTTVKDLVTKILNKKGLETRSVPVEEILLLETYDEHFQK